MKAPLGELLSQTFEWFLSAVSESEQAQPRIDEARCCLILPNGARTSASTLDDWDKRISRPSEFSTKGAAVGVSRLLPEPIENLPTTFTVAPASTAPSTSLPIFTSQK